MLKKIRAKAFIVFLSAVLIIFDSAMCFAQTALESDIKIIGEIGSIKIYGTTLKNTKVAGVVTKDGLNSKTAFVFADDCKSDENGYFEFPVFAMPDVENKENKCGGEYVAKLNINGEVITKTFRYYGADERQNLIDNINSAKDESELKNLFVSNKDILCEFGFVTDSIATEGDAFFKNVLESVPFASEEAFCKTVGDALLTTLINGLDENELYEFLKDNDGRGINLIFDEIKIINNQDMFKFICKYLAKSKLFKSVSDINNEIANGSVLYLLNNSSKLTLSENVSRYNSYIGISVSDLGRYTKSESAARDISGRVLDKMNRKGFESLSEVKIVICEQIDEYYKNKNSSSSSSPGGGGGGGGSSTGILKLPPDENQNNSNTDNIYQDSILNVFDDIDDVEWAQDAIESLYRKKIVSGRDNKSFAPNSPITREEFIKILLGVLEIKPVWNMTSFDDLDENMWYYSWVSTAEKFGITNGISKGRFGTGSNITREEAATTLMRGCSTAGISVNSSSDSTSVFDDFDQISDWAKNAVSALTSAGVINGRENGRFEPSDTITRAESAKLLYEILKLRSTGGAL